MYFVIASIATFLSFFRTTINSDKLTLKQNSHCPPPPRPQLIGRITILSPTLALSLSRSVGREVALRDRQTPECPSVTSLECSKLKL